MKTSADVIETVDQAIKPAREAADTAIRAGSREFRNLIAGVEDGVKHIQAKARHAAEGTDEFVHSNPWSAIGIAAAAGAAIAVLLSTRVQR